MSDEKADRVIKGLDNIEIKLDKLLVAIKAVIKSA